MKVTLLLSRFDQTGMTTHTIDLAKSLVSNNVITTLIVGYKNKNIRYQNELLEQALSSGAKVITVPPPDRKSIFSKLESFICLIYNVLREGGGNTCSIALFILDTLVSWKKIHLDTSCK